MSFRTERSPSFVGMTTTLSDQRGLSLATPNLRFQNGAKRSANAQHITIPENTINK
ncbi:hypothetical protein [Kaistella rhinocerotis]|uniref:hypothetical protein n=1 Tax=Kaistella rhinocerotis TaxID=3026437 RepID=UPI002555B54D|nr:hypothetical protein [Kaistella sp. Ran72]